MVAQEPLERLINDKKAEQKSPEEIEHEIEKTREALTVKLSRLEEEVEDKVRNTVDQVSGQIMDTVDHFTGKVKDGVERVQNQFDLRLRMQREPIRTMAIALGAGFAFGAWLAMRRRPTPLALAAGPTMPHNNGHQAIARAGIVPILKGIASTVAVTAAQRMIQSKVDNYLHSLQEAPRN